MMELGKIQVAAKVIHVLHFRVLFAYQSLCSCADHRPLCSQADHFTQVQPPEAKAVEAQSTGRAETEAVGQTHRQDAVG